MFRRSEEAVQEHDRLVTAPQQEQPVVSDQRVSICVTHCPPRVTPPARGGKEAVKPQTPSFAALNGPPMARATASRNLGARPPRFAPADRRLLTTITFQIYRIHHP